ncbi:MAG: 6-carboxytetrahydropterin synthase [Bryobacteraceae bacterium]
MMTITRLYRFSASHRLHSPRLSAAENVRLYGKCNNPFGHGHDYVLEVTATGTLDPRTGVLLPLSKLDGLVRETVLQLFAHSNINVDVPQFKHLVPTTENVALVIADLLQQNWDAYLGEVPARLHRVHIQETERNGFEVLLNAPRHISISDPRPESVTLNA